MMRKIFNFLETKPSVMVMVRHILAKDAEGQKSDQHQNAQFYVPLDIHLSHKINKNRVNNQKSVLKGTINPINAM